MYATMDIGTNSCRLLIAGVQQHAGLQVVERQLRTTRIGEGMNSTQRLIKPSALERTIAAFAEFAEIINDYPVRRISLVATQAVRMAENNGELSAAIKAGFGWDVQIISGEREAWLSYLGATKNLGEENQPLVIDIGGGSTEFIRKVGQEKVEARSIPLGALKLFENPYTDSELADYLAEALAGFAVNLHTDKPLLVGVGGTCTTLAAVALGLQKYDPERVQGSQIPVAAIAEIYDRLKSMPVAERLSVPGIYPGREDIIVPGLQLLRAILKYLQAPLLTVSDQDLLFGLIYEQLGCQV